MRIIVAGSRSFDDRELLFKTLDEVTARLDKKKLVILSGHAQGVDRLGEEWAAARMVTYQIYHPDWEKYGKAAGMRRNIEMVADADALVAMWDGESPGTEDVITKARKAGLKVKVLIF